MQRGTKCTEKDEPELPAEKEGAWAEDQRELGYYYDDAHGYERYEPEKDEDDIPAKMSNRKEKNEKAGPHS
ncbi:MAG: hypothetical protein H0X08_00745 [Blastocatellia bacterium]|nr:hypothetical protein [Blastocatellia bacterium]